MHYQRGIVKQTKNPYNYKEENVLIHFLSSHCVFIFQQQKETALSPLARFTSLSCYHSQGIVSFNFLHQAEIYLVKKIQKKYEYMKALWVTKGYGRFQ